MAVRPRFDKLKREMETEKAEALDDLSEFESFRKDLLPKLRDAIKQGKKTPEILELAKAMSAARLAAIAVFEPDNKVALTAVRDLLDRLDGKATENKKVQHVLADAREQEVDAVLLTALSDLEASED